MDACLWSNLPEIALELVFARLPLKDIVRLQTLNTHWKVCIRSSFFQQNFEEVSSARFGLLTQLIKGPRSLCWDFHVFDTPAAEWHHFPLSALGPISTGVYPIATAGGLVCLSNIYGERVFVVNPVTNACRKLPQDASNCGKYQFLTMALMEITHSSTKHYTLTLALTRKPWPEGSNLTSLLCEQQVNASHFSFAVYDSGTDCWSSRDKLTPGLLDNKSFRLFPSGAAVMAAIDGAGNQVFRLIPKPLNIAPKADWMEAPNDSNSQGLAYGVKFSWLPQSVDIYKLPSAGQLDWKKVSSVPGPFNKLLQECKCFVVGNEKVLLLVKCRATAPLFYNKFPVSMCDLATCTWQELPSILPAGAQTSNLETEGINMAGLAGCAFEVKFDAVPWSNTLLLKVAIWGLSTLQTTFILNDSVFFNDGVAL